MNFNELRIPQGPIHELPCSLSTAKISQWELLAYTVRPVTDTLFRIRQGILETEFALKNPNRQNVYR